jgi:succinate dehydrogenase / fumarate reductase flavoprotein subunit
MAGVHGANRLGGNSLAETVAYGVVTGTRVAERVDGPGTVPSHTVESLVEPHLAELAALAGSDGAYGVDAVVAELRECLWNHAGILRDDATLVAGLETLDRIREKATDVAVGPITSRSFEYAIDLGFMLTSAEAVLRGARERTESRGAHHRTDHPDPDTAWRRNIYYDQADIGGMTTHTEPVAAPNEAVQAALDAGHELDYHQLE